MHRRELYFCGCHIIHTWQIIIVYRIYKFEWMQLFEFAMAASFAFAFSCVSCNILLLVQKKSGFSHISSLSLHLGFAMIIRVDVNKLMLSFHTHCGKKSSYSVPKPYYAVGYSFSSGFTSNCFTNPKAVVSSGLSWEMWQWSQTGSKISLHLLIYPPTEHLYFNKGDCKTTKWPY